MPDGPGFAPFDTDIGWDDGDDCQTSSAAAVMGAYDPAAPNIEDIEARYLELVPGWDNSPPDPGTLFDVIRGFGYEVLKLHEDFADPWPMVRRCLDAGRPIVAWTVYKWPAVSLAQPEKLLLHAELIVGLTQNWVQLLDQQNRNWHGATFEDFTAGRSWPYWDGELYLIQPAGWGYPQEEPVSNRVAGVVTADTRRDISELINAAAANHGFDAIGFLAGLIGESNLHERATRERAWPDVSYGLSQPTVAFLHPDSGLPLTRDARGVALDTPENRRLVREWAHDAANLIPYTARRYAELIRRFDTGGDPLRTWTRWNAPGRTLEENLAAQPDVIRNYRNGLAEARKYRAQEAPAVTIPSDIIDLRGQLPTLGWGQTYVRGSLDEIVDVTYHYTASSPSGSVRSIAEYQISAAATPQTGVNQPFPGIAYTGVVKGDGAAHLCWDLEVRTWHAPGHNQTSRAICFIGDGAPTPVQIAGMARLHVLFEAIAGRQLGVRGHKDDYATSCPGGWPTFKATLVAAIAKRRADLQSTPTVSNPPASPDADAPWRELVQLGRDGQADLATLIEVSTPGNLSVSEQQALTETYRIAGLLDAKADRIRELVAAIKSG